MRLAPRRTPLMSSAQAIFAALLLLAAAAGAMSPALAEAPRATPGLASLGKAAARMKMTAMDGRSITLADLKGRPQVLFFGFTHCPVVCPVTVWEIDAALAEIGAPAADVRIVFVSLDPARDTPERTSSYFEGFGGRVVALTPAQADLRRLTRAYNITFERVETGDGNYTIDHSTIAFLVNAKGYVVDTLAFGASRKTSAAKLRKLLRLPPS